MSLELIGATVLIYVGIGISTYIYNHPTYQLITMISGALVTLVFKETRTLGSRRFDDVDLPRIPLATLRARLACLLQNSVSLHGSVGSNLRLFTSAADNEENAHLPLPWDAELIAALTKARIWDVIVARGDGGGGGLDASLTSLYLSPSRRQLFYLGVAALRSRWCSWTW